jgi:hypothetical protein
MAKGWQEAWDQYSEGPEDVASTGNQFFGYGSYEASQAAKDAFENPPANPGNLETMPEVNPTPAVQYTPAPYVMNTSMLPSEEYLQGQIDNPTAPLAGIQQPIQQQVQANELMDPNTGQIATPTQGSEAQFVKAETSTGQAAAGSVDPIAQQEAIKAQEFEADKDVAEQGTVTLEATMQGQMANLMDDIASGNAPWADEAMRNAQSIMLERGLGKSSMTGSAIGSAILEAAMPIAQYDAGVFGEMNLQNLRNRQETMLSNTAASNVAKQINAQSVNEVNKFMASMRDSVIKHNDTMKNNMEQMNVAAKNAMEQMNVSARNTTEQFNVTQFNTMEQFNAAQRLQYAQLEIDAEKWNAENALAIQKTNVEWRRTTNTANTAAVNSANMINAQNYFNISSQAQANLLQRSRDVFQWANQTGENERDRAFQMTMYAMQQEDYLDALDDQAKDDIWSSVSDFAFDIFAGFDFGGEA